MSQNSFQQHRIIETNRMCQNYSGKYKINERNEVSKK